SMCLFNRFLRIVDPCPVLSLRIGFSFAFCAGVVFPAAAQLFSDDFSRSTDPGPIAPWIEHSGNWVVSGGAMAVTQPIPYSYSTAYITNSWTNYMVQARIRFSSFDVYGGGIGGRLNPCCGMRYGVWVYPNFPTQGVNTL